MKQLRFRVIISESFGNYFGVRISGSTDLDLRVSICCYPSLRVFSSVFPFLIFASCASFADESQTRVQFCQKIPDPAGFASIRSAEGKTEGQAEGKTDRKTGIHGEGTSTLWENKVWKPTCKTKTQKQSAKANRRSKAQKQSAKTRRKNKAQKQSARREFGQ